MEHLYLLIERAFAKFQASDLSHDRVVAYSEKETGLTDTGFAKVKVRFGSKAAVQLRLQSANSSRSQRHVASRML